jgi:7-carboxy-7-deazaguanine synthase
MSANGNQTLVISEIFHSIQGESTYAGRPCVFVRLTACNLRCSYCDTEYAFTGGKPISIDEIVGIVEGYQCRLVEVTGGEPLLQDDVHSLMTALCDRGFEVLLETGGACDIRPVDNRVHRIVDCKCPSSGMSEKNFWPNFEAVTGRDEVKFVIGSRDDYEWSKDVVARFRLTDRCTILFSPVHGALEPQELPEWILHDRLGVRFQLQLHKLIWHPDTRGV